MLERVIAYIERHKLLPERGTLVVAVSGGADSLCLLHLLQRICGPGQHFPAVSLHAAHLNHMLRGAESASDAALVAETLKAWNIPLTSGAINVLALAKTEKRSLEDAARLARYRFLREVAQGRRIAVAHHMDDQVETILLHWLRGSGLAGMIGMPPRQQDIIRPLLEITRDETHAYCHEQGITPLEDHSNSDPRFLRNRIRHEVVPLLSDLNSGISRTILRNAEVARIDLDWLETQVDECWANIVVSEQAQTIKLNVRALIALPLSLQRHLLRRVTARLCEGQSPLEPRHFQLIEHLVNDRARRQERELHLPQRLHVRHQTNYLTFARLPVLASTELPTLSQQPEKKETLLSVPGNTYLPALPWEAHAELLPEEQAAKIRLALHAENWPTVWQMLEPVSPQIAYIDGEVAGNHLLVRTRRPGDRIQPLGMATEKRIQNIFIDNHVPRTERDTIPLFFSDKHCLWIAGSYIDHRARLTKQTRKIVRLSIRPV